MYQRGQYGISNLREKMFHVEAMNKQASLVVCIIAPHNMLTHDCFTAEDKVDFWLNTYLTN